MRNYSLGYNENIADNTVKKLSKIYSHGKSRKESNTEYYYKSKLNKLTNLFGREYAEYQVRKDLVQKFKTIKTVRIV